MKNNVPVSKKKLLRNQSGTLALVSQKKSTRPFNQTLSVSRPYETKNRSETWCFRTVVRLACVSVRDRLVSNLGQVHTLDESVTHAPS